MFLDSKSVSFENITINKHESKEETNKVMWFYILEIPVEYRKVSFNLNNFIL